MQNVDKIVIAGVAIATVVLSLVKLRRDDFERARQLHESLTTGEVAEARHVVGSAFEGAGVGEQVHLERLEQIQAFFIVLWCFERIDVARDTLLGRWSWLPDWINPRRLLDRGIQTHVTIYSNYLDRTYVNGSPLIDRLTGTPEDAGLRRLRERIASAAK
ncbi:hypothetical protein AB0J14_20820 [Micromonospora arborensis]|uniref:hypothetical protein n=1 Tax=Micromonospora arborensis TaxID=2116518 RepID=UPI0033D2E8E4